MLKIFPLVMVVALAGCSEKESAKLERQYDILKKANRSEEVLCAKGTEVAEAYLREENEDDYRKWSVYASTHCNSVAVDRLRLVS